MQMFCVSCCSLLFTPVHITQLPSLAAIQTVGQLCVYPNVYEVNGKFREHAKIAREKYATLLNFLAGLPARVNRELKIETFSGRRQLQPDVTSSFVGYCDASAHHLAVVVPSAT